jgi:hypothetical protein
VQSEKWEVGSGKCEVKSERWEMKSGKWKVQSEKWKMRREWCRAQGVVPRLKNPRFKNLAKVCGHRLARCLAGPPPPGFSPDRDGRCPMRLTQQSLRIRHFNPNNKKRPRPIMCSTSSGIPGDIVWTKTSRKCYVSIRGLAIPGPLETSFGPKYKGIMLFYQGPGIARI